MDRRRLYRVGLALLLGGIGAAVNLWTVPILTEDTPNFFFGGIPVLLAFIGLGPRLGLLAGALSLLPFLLDPWWTLHPAPAIGTLIYLVEGLAIYHLYRRTRSLPLAAAIFWFGGGWVLTVLVYHLWLGLAGGFVAIFVVKQLLNGIVNAVVAEFLLGERLRDLFARFHGEESPESTPVETFAFRWVTVLTLAPVVTLLIVQARSEYMDAIHDLGDVNAALAWEAVSEMDDFLRERHQVIADIGRTTLLGIGDQGMQAHLDRFMELYPEFYLVARTDSLGAVRQSSPRTNAAGVSLEGIQIGDRAYFTEARETGSLTYGELLLGDLGIRGTGRMEPAVVIAQPLSTPTGVFEGVLVASLDPVAGAQRVDVAFEAPAHRVTLMDRRGTVIGSTAPGRTAGTEFAGWFDRAGGTRGADAPLLKRDQPGHFSFFPPPGGGIESRVGLDLVHGSYQPVLRSGWGVLVDSPAAVLHDRLFPVALRTLALIALALLLLWIVVQGFSRRIALPLVDAAGSAQRIAGGNLETSAPRFTRLEEARDLATSLDEMRLALARKEAETEARQKELEAQLLQAQKMEAVGLLAGGVAHDFNNMLTPILGLADLGREDSDSEVVREHFREIGFAATRAREVVQQLLAFSRKQVLSMDPVELGSELERIRTLLRSLLRENVELTIEVRDGPHPVLADPAQLSQVFLNLAVNAQDAMVNGGRLALRLDRVTAGPDALSEEGLAGIPLARVTVTDTGPGIPPETLRHIFDPFFTTKQPGEGTGLGLATVYGIIRQHGGAVRVTSVEGEGTTFILYLPLTDQTPREPAPRKDAVRRTPAAGERILLVEDDMAVRRFVERILERQGYEVTAMASGERALEHADGFDLLMTDVVLPGVNGRELYERLAARNPGMRALFMSGYSHDILGDNGLPEGTRFLSKPFELDELLDQVRAALNQ